MDDQPEILRLLERLLVSHHVVTVDDAAEALAVLSAGAFDVVVTDYDMPRLNGCSLLVRIAVIAPDVHRILFSGGESDLRGVAEICDRIAATRQRVRPCSTA